MMRHGPVAASLRPTGDAPEQAENFRHLLHLVHYHTLIFIAFQKKVRAGPLPGLPGTFTVLADSRMADAEILRWLFTPDATLPAPGAPIDALIAGFKTEVRRRAMEAAF